jgi:C_GCAxxG_C_C family probable redox protein
MSGVTRTLDPETAGRLASDLFTQGFNCAEAVVQGLLWDDEGASVAGQRMATAFGGGIARRGGTCGALQGAAMAIGFLAGRERPDDDEGKDRVYALVGALFERVLASRGSVECRVLTGLDFAVPESHDIFDAEVKDRVCVPLVREVARLAAEALARSAGE